MEVSTDAGALCQSGASGTESGRKVLRREGEVKTTQGLTRYATKEIIMKNRMFYIGLGCALSTLFWTITAFAQQAKVDQEKTEDITFELTKPLEFVDRPSTVNFITKANIEKLRNRPILTMEEIDIGKGTLHSQTFEGVTLKKKGEEIRVRTCREYDDALLAGYRPGSTYDITMASWFKYPCVTLQLLQRATRHKRSFLPTRNQELFDLKLLPLKLFPIVTDYEQTYGRDIENETYHDQAEKGELEVIEKTPHKFVCKDDGLKQYLTEVVRADFNGDGTEDILLNEAVAAIDATYRTYNLIILTRESSKAKYEIIFQSGFVILPKHLDNALKGR